VVVENAEIFPKIIQMTNSVNSFLSLSKSLVPSPRDVLIEGALVSP